MKFTSQNRNRIIVLLLFLLILITAITYRYELKSYYYAEKYSGQIDNTKTVIELIKSENDDNYKKYFTKDSLFLSNPEYIRQARAYFGELDTKSFAPIYINRATENGIEVLFIILANKNDYHINFKLTKIDGQWKISVMHGDP